MIMRHRVEFKAGNVAVLFLKCLLKEASGKFRTK